MSTELIKFYQEQNEDSAKQILEAEPVPPTEVLGNIALVYLLGGAMAHGAVMPRTEALAIEGAVATTEVGDKLRQAA